MCTWELVLGDPPFLPAARMGPEKTPPSGGHRDPAGSSPPPAPSSSPLSSLEGSAASTSERSPSAGAQGSLGAGTWQDTDPQARVTRSPSAPGLFTVQGLRDSEG